MKNNKIILCVAISATMTALVLAQGGQGGLGAGFGGGGQQGGMQQQIYNRSAERISEAIARYLDTQPIMNILTPGGFSEWTLDLKPGQVVIAEAWSEAFDPMIEVFDGKSVKGTNDDRYPGDQRPLLLYRAEKEGKYSLRARSFRDKAGGQFFIKFKIFDSVDLVGTETAQRKTAGTFLTRVHLKAGEIRQVFEVPRPNDYLATRFEQVISPIGLPITSWDANIEMVAPDSIFAPVDGDYYVLTNSSRDGDISIGSRTLPVAPLKPVNGNATGTAVTTTPAFWSIDVKAGELIEVTISDVHANSPLIATTKPEYEKFNLQNAEQNPFFPETGAPENKGPKFALLPAKARDNRRMVIAVLEDTTLWLGTRGHGAPDKQFALTVKPAARDFGPAENRGSLKIGMHDYWVYDAKVGDVMRFKSSAQGFAHRVTVRDSQLGVLVDQAVSLDADAISWDFFAERAGTYLVEMSCIGDGGGGEYKLERTSYSPRVFTKDTPATDRLEQGAVHVWKLTATPDQPLLVHWKSSGWNFGLEVRNENGGRLSLPLTVVDNQNRYGVLKVNEPTTFIIVLRSIGDPIDYSINLTDLPGRGS